jgi:pimeloyl-ACP methyl ester carboxylesterase
MTRTLWIRLIAAAAAAFWAQSVQAAGLKLTPIEFRADDGRTVAAERGEITVREDRADPKSRPLKLVFVRFKATTARPGAPIVYLAGGPGGSGVATAKGVRFDVFMKLREAGDVIAFDQRGTGESTRIPACRTPWLDVSQTVTRERMAALYTAGVQRCWAEWKAQGIAIDAWNSWESAADIDELRRDLGARKLSLWGISYGTHLALAYIKRYPARVDRAILASVEGLDQTVKLPLAEDAVLARIAAVVAADPDAATPDLVGLMRRVHARLDAAPARFPLPPGTPEGAAFTADSFTIRAFAGVMIKNPETIGPMISVYRALDAGAYAQIGPVLGRQMFGQVRAIEGMPAAMDLASGISPARLALVQAQARTAILGDALNFPMPHAVGAIPGIDLGENFRAPFRFGRPVLLLEGDLDGRTALEEQAAATTGLTKKTTIIVRGAGHDIFEAEPRLWPLMAAFLAGRPVASQEIVRPLDIVPRR